MTAIPPFDVDALALAQVDSEMAGWRMVTERRIAFGRVAFFGSLTAVAFLGWAVALRGGRPPIAPFHFAFCSGMALLFYRFRVEIGRRSAWIAATIAFDCANLALPAAIPNPANPFFADVSAAGLLVVASIHALRTDRTVAVLAYLLGGAFFYGSSWMVRFGTPVEGLNREVLGRSWVTNSAVSDSIVFACFLIGAAVAAGAAAAVRDRMRSLAQLTILKSLVPAEAAERVGRSMKSETVTVTILASDLRGYTAMCDRLTPEETVSELNAYHAAMLGVMQDHGGTLDKFIGDGALVVFRGSDDGAGAAVACAAAMLRKLEAHNIGRTARGRPPLGIGIGVHTGQVVSGLIGAGGRLEWTVIGDAVNTASRVEGLTKSAGVPALATWETARRLASSALPELPAMEVRGKSVAVRIFSIER